MLQRKARDASRWTTEEETARLAVWTARCLGESIHTPIQEAVLPYTVPGALQLT